MSELVDRIPDGAVRELGGRCYIRPHFPMMGDDDIAASIFVGGRYICGGDIGLLFSWIY